MIARLVNNFRGNWSAVERFLVLDEGFWVKCFFLLEPEEDTFVLVPVIFFQSQPHIQDIKNTVPEK